MAQLDNPDNNAKPYERVWYTPYGQARHHWGQDFDGDRDFDSADTSALLNKISGGSVPITDTTNYDVEYDLNRDGTIDFNDLPSGSAQTAVPLGQIDRLDGVNTGPDNWIGYAGYVWEGASSLYHVRFRSYSPSLGRWMQRDPAGYVDGMSKYQYAVSHPAVYSDALGLESDVPCDLTNEQRLALLDRAEARYGNRVWSAYGLHSVHITRDSMLVRIVEDSEYAACLAKCAKDNPEYLAMALAGGGWNLLKEEVTAALALPRMLLFLQVDRDGNLTLDGERIGSGIAEHLADTFEQVGERCLSDIEAIEDSFAEALERAARNGDVSGADREAILRKLREFRGGARGNLTRTAQGALRAAGGSGAAARALRRAGHIGAVATSLQLAWNMIHELMDECAPQCNKFKPRGCSD